MSRRVLGSAQPAELILASRTGHVIAALGLLDRNLAGRTLLELLLFAGPLSEKAVALVVSRLPLAVFFARASVPHAVAPRAGSEVAGGADELLGTPFDDDTVLAALRIRAPSSKDVIPEMGAQRERLIFRKGRL